MRAIACALLLVAAACTRSAPSIGFTFTDGTRTTLADQRGRVVWLEFWSLSCAPCIEELPTMRALNAQWDARDVAVIAVAMPWDPPAPVAEFVARQRLPWPVALDLDACAANAFDVQAVPYRVLIGRDGAIAYRQSGRLDADSWRSRVMAMQASSMR